MTTTHERPVEAEEAKRLRKLIRRKKVGASEGEDALTAAMGATLERLGQFYRLEDGTPIFFRHQARKVYEVSDKPESDFAELVTYLCDVSGKTGMLGRAINRLRASVAHEAKTVRVHGLAYNGTNAEVIAINDFRGGMWYRQQGGQWEWRPNGHDGILFWTPGGIVELWKPEFGDSPSADERHLDWLVQQPHFAADVLTVDDQRMLFRALLLVPFFPARGRIRPVHAHLGLGDKRQHDTGKTLAGKMIGLLIVGPRFEPMPPPESSEKGVEALQLALMHNPFVLLDNVDTGIKWLNDFLCTYATGAEPTRRMLYTDTQQVRVECRGRLVITSRKPSFKRADTASRTIPLRFAPIAAEERKTERELLRPLFENRGRIWAGVLAAAARVQDGLSALEPPPPTLRLADFEQFGWCVAAAHGEVEKWQAMVPRLRLAQAGFAMEGEALVPILKALLERGDGAEQKTSDLWTKAQKVAEELGSRMDLPLDAAGFTRSLNELREPLEALLDAKIRTRTLHGHTRIEITRNRAPDPGDRGDHSSELLCVEEGI